MWIYVPNSHSSPSAPEGADSISALNWRFQVLESSVTWRETHSRSAIWYQRWKRAQWLARLCSRMCEPSQADRGVADFLDSLPVILASPFRSPASGKARTTRATSGRRSGASSTRRGLWSCFSKMSPRTSHSDPTLFSESFDDLAMRLRRDCSRRQKSARATGANGSLSSPSPSGGTAAWTTPQAHDAKTGDPARVGRFGTEHGGKNLADDVMLWPTPATRDHKGANGPEHLEKGGGQAHLGQLPNYVEHLWTTPMASDATKGGPASRFGNGTMKLAGQTAQWRTPAAGSPNSLRGLGEDPEKRKQAGHTVNLQDQVHGWPTPRACSGKRSSGGNRTDILSRFNRPDPGTLMPGPTSPGPIRDCFLRYLASTDSALRSERRGLIRMGLQARRKGWAKVTIRPAFRKPLNPRFVEWLMMWPRGWTSFECSATAFTLYRRRMRSALLSLGLPPEAPPAQLSFL